MRVKTLLRLSGSAVMASSLAACGGNGGGSTPTPTPAPSATPSPAPAASFQSLFGTAFAAIFNASPTSDPIDPTAGSVPALAPASDPLDNGAT